MCFVQCFIANGVKQQPKHGLAPDFFGRTLLGEPEVWDYCFVLLVCSVMYVPWIKRMYVSYALPLLAVGWYMPSLVLESYQPSI